MKEKKVYRLPPIGMRIIKSAVAVFLCFVVYVAGGRQGIPFYAAIGALFCIQPYVGSSLKMAWHRFIGTMVGAIFGLVVVLLEVNVWSIHGKIPGFIIVSLVIIAVLYTSSLLSRVNVAYFSCVVFLSITITHITDSNPYIFVLERVLDTTVGVIIGVLVNVVRIPRKKRTDTLFVSGLDGTLLDNEEKMTPYSQITLNRMLEDGLKFTIATSRTPASLMETTKNLHLNLPIIAMDGAALYDIKEKAYRKVYVISHETAKKVMDFFKQKEVHYFLNCILDDVLLIYYGEFKNKAEEALFYEYRKSPYRNYIDIKHYSGGQVVYLMVFDTEETIDALILDLKKEDFSAKLKIVKYFSSAHPGYCHLRIYNKNASKKNMLDYFLQNLNLDKVVTMGSAEGKYDIMAPSDNPNQVVRQLEKMFEPYFFRR